MAGNGASSTLLGNLLLNHGMIPEEKLEEALRRQETAHEPLGQILLAMGAVSQEELDLVLRAQARLRGKSGRNQPHILIVDDDPEVGAVVGDILAGAGYSVGVAQNAQEALAALSSADANMPTLVVLDLAMPGMSGVELLPELRKLAPRTTRYIVLSGNPDMVSEMQAKKMAVQEFVMKPSPARELVAIIDRVLTSPGPAAR